ncbi:hypothetical protein AB0I16_07990 [Streptomyces sp. NPDC050703]|uniref:hypothetical protein n=1 Tax=Streptomyces sp. NPDC050703 TaxID=3157218 RepID=UPI00342C2EB0
MPSFSDSDRPSDESAEELRRKERELAEAEAKAGRRLRVANRLLAVRVALAAAEALTGNPAYRSAGIAVQWAVDRLHDPE